jgi:hypothetical protein
MRDSRRACVCEPVSPLSTDIPDGVTLRNLVTERSGLDKRESVPLKTRTGLPTEPHENPGHRPGTATAPPRPGRRPPRRQRKGTVNGHEPRPATPHHRHFRDTKTTRHAQQHAGSGARTANRPDPRAPTTATGSITPKENSPGPGPSPTPGHEREFSRPGRQRPKRKPSSRKDGRPAQTGAGHATHAHPAPFILSAFILSAGTRTSGRTARSCGPRHPAR